MCRAFAGGTNSDHLAVVAAFDGWVGCRTGGGKGGKGGGRRGGVESGVWP